MGLYSKQFEESCCWLHLVLVLPCIPELSQNSLIHMPHIFACDMEVKLFKISGCACTNSAYCTGAVWLYCNESKGD